MDASGLPGDIMDVFHREEAAGRAPFDVGDLVIKHLVSKSGIFKSGKTELN